MKRFVALFFMAALVFSLAIPCYAADDGSPLVVDGVSYPVYTSQHGNIIEWVNEQEYNHALICTTGAATRLYLIEGYFYIHRQGYFVTETPQGNGQYHQYTFSNGAWVFNSTNKLSSGGYSGSVSTVIASDLVFYNQINSTYNEPHIRFRGALPQMILEVAGEQLKVTLPEMGGTMKILVLCGVGLMASLVVLKLFGKRSLIFLRR